LEYIEKAEREGRSPATIAKLKWSREWLQPAIGRRPVDQIEPHELLAVLRKQEARGNLETARRTRAFASRVFRYAVATARAKADPAGLLLGAVAAPQPRHLSAIVEPKRVGELLRAIDGYSGLAVTELALALSPHVFVRPGELRQAAWSEIDIDAAVWRIPAARMKKRREHVVPLSRQALAILAELRGLTGHGRLLFPALGKPDKPLSENTVTGALRRMGFEASEMTAHGFRAMASTLLNECGRWHPDAIERALAHRDRDQVRAAYHRGMHWEERVKMAQWWSDHLDVLRSGATIVLCDAADSALFHQAANVRFRPKGDNRNQPASGKRQGASDKRQAASYKRKRSDENCCLSTEQHRPSRAAENIQHLLVMGDPSVGRRGIRISGPVVPLVCPAEYDAVGALEHKAPPPC
jgi:integrase